MFEASWKAAGYDAPPKLLGRTWDTMADDPDQRPPTRPTASRRHYDQHVWIFRDNPKGPLEPYNTQMRPPAPTNNTYGAAPPSSGGGASQNGLPRDRLALTAP